MYTIATPICVTGIAPYTGNMVQLNIKPSTKGGIQFIYLGKSISLKPQYLVVEDQRHSTAIRNKGIEVYSIEHLLSALHGLNISSLEVELIGDNQIPALDGSADTFTKLLLGAGRMRAAEINVVEIVKKLELVDNLSSSMIRLEPNTNGLKIKTTIDFPNLLGRQEVSLDLSEKSFKSEIAWARTFLSAPINGLHRSWEDVRNTLPVLPKEPKDSPVIVYDDNYYITPLIKNDEPARHKTLDFVGDIYALGCLLSATVYLYKPSHKLNHTLVRQLYEDNLVLFDKIWD